MELIAVIALMTLVFGGIVSLLISMYSSYEQTSSVSENGREATMIINQLAQDIRKSVEDIEQVPEPVQVDAEANWIRIYTVKHDNTTPQIVEYRNQNGHILYSTEGTEIELSQSGHVTVDALVAKKRYKITVVVGSGEGQAEMTTEVARYDWSENVDENSEQ